MLQSRDLQKVTCAQDFLGELSLLVSLAAGASAGLASDLVAGVGVAADVAGLLLSGFVFLSP